MKHSLFALALSIATTAAFASIGCGSSSEDASNANADEADELGESADELNARGKALAGSYLGKGSTSSPSFIGLVLQPDGTFFGDIDTGLQCEEAPCNNAIRVQGYFVATAKYLTLKPIGMGNVGLYGRYRYVVTDGALTLSRASISPDWTSSLEKAPSYCSSVDDCDFTSAPRAACAGAWKCGTQSRNACTFVCGTSP